MLDGGNYTGYMFCIGGTTANRLEVVLRSSVSNDIYLISSINVADGAWRLVGITYNGTKTAAGTRLYINGVDDTSRTTQNDALTGEIQNTVTDLLIGVRGTTKDYSGLMGDMWIYKRVLTALEIQHKYLTTRWRYQ